MFQISNKAPVEYGLTQEQFQFQKVGNWVFPSLSFFLFIIILKFSLSVLQKAIWIDLIDNLQLIPRYKQEIKNCICQQIYFAEIQSSTQITHILFWIDKFKSHFLKVNPIVVYSSLLNNRAGWNNHVGWPDFLKSINMQDEVMVS